MPDKKDYLKEVIEHIDIKKHNVVQLVDAMENMAFTARDLNRAARIYDMMIKDKTGISHRVPWKQGILKAAKIFF